MHDFDKAFENIIEDCLPNETEKELSVPRQWLRKVSPCLQTLELYIFLQAALFTFRIYFLLINSTVVGIDFYRQVR